jgi:coenzyme F420 hydrogenase subunit beta
MSPEIPPPQPHRSLCTDCGVSRSSAPERCAQACQFIQPDHRQAEILVHGRSRQTDSDERFFGPYQSIWRAQMRQPVAGAQWTGITTEMAKALLVKGMVDAVITVSPDPHDRWRPVAELITHPEDLSRCRGMRMGFAPVLSLVEPALQRGLKRLAVIAIPCQVYPLRQLEAQWRKEFGLQSLYVIGTPCSDNTTTEHFHQFLALIAPKPEAVNYLEFRPDYKVEVREVGGRVFTIPFLNLPLSKLPQDFFPMTCRTCVDYTNTLADITVGYMGGSGQQWVLVRNAQGQAMLDGLEDRVQLEPAASAGQRQGAVKGFLNNTLRAAGGLPLRRTPGWLRPLVNWLMPKIGPRGLEFARARVEMKAIESVVHLRRHHPARVKHMIPTHVWQLVKPYGLMRQPQEIPVAAANGQNPIRIEESS